MKQIPVSNSHMYQHKTNQQLPHLWLTYIRGDYNYPHDAIPCNIKVFPITFSPSYELIDKVCEYVTHSAFWVLFHFTVAK